MQQIEALGTQSTTAFASPAESARPAYLTNLETVYGVPSQAAFGSAVFTETLGAGADLTDAALAQYQYFVGDLWEHYGEDAWLEPWKEVYARPTDAVHDIVAELRAIDDPDAALAVSMILDNIADATKARTALSLAYDGPTVTDVRVFTLGDGGAMSGILVAALHQQSAEAIFLVFLLD